jgi:allantoin racemase
MRIVYINPNATRAMTDSIVGVARQALPKAEILGLTNTDGPPAIEGPDDGDAAIPGVLDLVRSAQEADAIVIACFDDTGLAMARQAATCPVLGIGQSAYLMAQILGQRFSVVTSVEVSVPVIRSNIQASGFGASCVSVRASGLPVLEIERASTATRERLADAIRDTAHTDGAGLIVLGCAGMAALRADLAHRSQTTLIDGVTASAVLAEAAWRHAQTARHP